MDPIDTQNREFMIDNSVMPFQRSAAQTLGDLLQCGLSVRPDAPAVVDLDRAVSFRTLHDMSVAIAHEMSSGYHVRFGERVVVLAEKSATIVAVALACWRLGAIYVPVDPGNPPNRIDTILDSIQPALVVSTESRLAAAAASVAPYPQLSYERCGSLPSRTGGDPERAVPQNAAALIIHTSGSTGTPKGVVLSHASVIEYFRNHNEFLAFGPASVGMNNGPFYFDVSVQDTFLPLYFGASVVFHRGLWVSAVILSLILKYRVTHFIAVSSILELISKDQDRLRSLADSNLKVVVTGGEVCAPRLLNRWLATVDGLRVLYGYGPTEVNSLCTTFVITEPEPERVKLFPIGKPFRGHKALLLDHDRAVVDIDDVVGTLAISGPQLMLGYWKDPLLTSSVIFEHVGERYYVTGDRCHRDPDGNYHFDGRMDSEVKIRGRRINLNEIRNALTACEDVSHAVVVTAEVEGETRIVAGVTITDTDDTIEERLLTWLGLRVPDYMVPWYIGIFATAVRTATDKIDERQIKTRLLERIAVHPHGRYFRVAG
ncbi:AMP-binding protein [Paraburkholderia sp. BCC1876]|uniref:AMP-binding protein n=1 Tax=Paraburkholderia sp. BCC1876 TaxID=2676303 RepID=UPI0015906979|nr:AMP-binding protein [Paraburkholderia sp. BCC1876]